jgi:uncharacterized protein (TIRG00374 family)
MKHENIAKIAAVAITIALVAILLSQIQIADVVTTLASINPLYLIVGFVLYVCSYFFRALRFHILLNREVKLRDLFNIVCVHNMVNNILPARTGELSYIYLLKKLHNKTTGDGIATLFVARVFDFVAISLLFFISVMCIKDLPDVIDNVISTVIGFLALMILILIVFVYFRERFMQIAKKNIKISDIKRFSVIRFFLRKAEETVNSFEMVKSKKVVSCSFLISIAIWCSLYFMIYILLNEMGVNLNIWLVILGSTFSLVSTILPIQGIGGFGTFEGGWVIAFMVLGLSKQMAISTGFSMHIIGFIITSILGGYGVYALKIKGRI